ncbi:MAG: heme-binding protein [Verrucomicrobiota bacterium]
MKQILILTCFVFSLGILSADENNKSVAAGKDQASGIQWIWSESASENQTIYARRQWTQKAKAKSATLDITCDDSYTVFLNGTKIGGGEGWESKDRFQIADKLANGDNVLAVEARNKGSKAGLVARLTIVNEDKTQQIIVTNGDWLVSSEKLDGWQGPSVAASGWSKATSQGALGAKPWGNPLAANTKAKPKAKGRPDPGPLKIVEAAEAHVEGFEVEKIYDVPKAEQGSWVAMAVDDEGRLYCSDQDDKGLFRVTIGDVGVEVEKVPVEVTGAQGLLWHRGVLYAGINGGKPTSGLAKITDSDGDGTLDTVEMLREIPAGGEHGIHAVVPSPDGESLFLFAGNKTAVPDPETYSVLPNFGEDQLVPSMIDARGHAKDLKAPGGWIARTDLEGKSFDFHAAGFRNQYDGAFNADGELFAYDSDMEWDIGAPWYRPTRIYHVTSGAEFGWRTGSGKFPEWFPDVLPPVLDVGPGSPTGVVSGLGAKFPSRYQNAIYAFDWTYGTIYALHTEAAGASYSMTKEEFVTGVPLSLSDGVVSPDGNLYFAVGGRKTDSAVYRVTYTGDESTDPAPVVTEEGSELRALRRELESYHMAKEGAVDAIWPHMGHEDRFIRYAARIALEHQPVEEWADKAIGERDTEASLNALLALARQGSSDHMASLSARLTRTLGTTLTEEQNMVALRTLNLAMIRLGELNEVVRSRLATTLSSRYPGSSDRLNRELVYTLVALKAPDVVAKTVPLLKQESISTEGVEVSKELIARSDRYGAVVAQSLEASPQKLQMWFAYVLRDVDFGWSEDLRRKYLEWFGRAQNFKGGLSFQGFVENIRQSALAAIPNPEERAALDKMSQEPIALIPEGFDDAREIEIG